MNEIGIFIMPSNEVSDEISEWKDKFLNEFGKQLYLDHMPHLTLATFNTSNLNEVIKKVKKYCSSFNKNLLIEIKETDEFLEDPLTKSITPYYLVNKNEDLINFQKDLLSNISNFVKSKFEVNFDNQNYNINNNNFGYPFVGKDWIPHLTICSLENIYIESQLKKEFLEFIPDHKFYTDHIEIYEINKSEHKKLEEIYINVE